MDEVLDVLGTDSSLGRDVDQEFFFFKKKELDSMNIIPSQKETSPKESTRLSRIKKKEYAKLHTSYQNSTSTPQASSNNSYTVNTRIPPFPPSWEKPPSKTH